VDQGAAPVNLISAIEFGKQQGMQIHPDAGLVPGLQIVSAGLAATAPKFGRQIVPSDTGLEDEQNASENLAVVQRLAAGKPKTPLGRRRQQRLNSFPQGIGNKYVHGTTSSGSEDSRSRSPSSCARAKRLKNSHYFRTLLGSKPYIRLYLVVLLPVR